MKKLRFTYSYRIKPLFKEKYEKYDTYFAFYANGAWHGNLSGPHSIMTTKNRWFAYFIGWPTLCQEESYHRYESNLNHKDFEHRWQAKRWIEGMTIQAQKVTKLFKDSGKTLYSGGVY